MKKTASHHFSLTLVGAGLLFVAAVALCGYSLFYPTEKDAEEYRMLVQTANPTNSREPVAPYTAKQHREGIQKAILFSQGNDRLQLRIYSREADMVLEHQEMSNELVEQMQGVVCYMQEELFYLLPDGSEALMQSNGRLLAKHADPALSSSWYNKKGMGIVPMQRIRYMEADTATYHYKNDKLVANEVKINRYSLPGHALIESVEGLKPVMQGIAKQVEFSLMGKDLNFKAHHLKATFSESEFSL